MATRSLPLNSIVLTVPAVEWELAVYIGAIEDPRTGLLYAPQSAELTAFQSWLPSSTTSTSTEIALAEPAGISLTNLMARCTAAINAAFPEPVWVRIEISQIRSSSGNLYVQAIERSNDRKKTAAR